MVVRRIARAFLFFFPVWLVVIQGHGQAPLGDLYSADATVKGSVALTAASTRLMSGSSVKAGLSNASVHLIRGGELRVCQGSSVSLTSSTNGTQIMIGMSSGTIEAHYPLANSRDSIMTPDFEIALVGPGLFHLAVSTDEGGNTCVQSLEGNTRPATVSELMGDGSYTVRPGEQLMFRAGNARNPGPVVANCGCPSVIPRRLAATEPLKPGTTLAAAPPPPVSPLIESSPKTADVTAPPPAEEPGSVHIQVEAPFVFRASEPPPAPDAPVGLAEIRLSMLPGLSSLNVQPAPQEVAQTASQEPEKPKKKRHGLWGFLASIFKG
jgi:hypothetical protein